VKLYELHINEGIRPEPRSSVSGRLMAVKDQVKNIKRDAVEAGMKDEISQLEILIQRAQKNKSAVLSSKILDRVAQRINQVMLKLLQMDTQKTKRIEPRQTTKDTAKKYLNKLPAEMQKQIMDLNLFDGD